MKRTLLIVNTHSGSAGSVDEGELVAGLAKAGFEVAETIRLPDDELPKLEAVQAKSVEAIAILSGDGTIASVCQEMASWPGEILVLPGGTMNLLSRRLHGDWPVLELLEELATDGVDADTVPVIRMNGEDVFTGLIAGPTTRWGEVREGIRKLDIAELVDKVPEAWAATTSSENVRIEGRDGGYPAIFVEPLDDGKLGVRAFKAEGLGDMLSHGVAWLRRDFRDGPNDYLGEMREVTIIDESDGKMGLLVDGERADVSSPLTCKASLSTVRFVRVKQ